MLLHYGQENAFMYFLIKINWKRIVYKMQDSLAEHWGVDMIPISWTMGEEHDAQQRGHESKTIGLEWRWCHCWRWPHERQEKVRIGEGQQTASTEGSHQGELKCSTCCHTGPLSTEVADGVLGSIWPAKQGGGGLFFSINPLLWLHSFFTLFQQERTRILVLLLRAS